jgi:hypothetical protein
MSVSDAVTNLTLEQLEAIIKLRRAVPLATFLSVNGKARQACALRHHGWQDVFITYVNSMTRAFHNTGLKDALKMATLLSAIESFSIGIICKEDLTLEEYNLIIQPIAEVAMPEMFAKVQDWTPLALPSPEVVAKEYFKAQVERDKTKLRTYKEEDLDPDGDLIDTNIDPATFLKAIGPKKKEPEKIVPKLGSKEAVAAMLAAMAPKTKKVLISTPNGNDEAVRIEKIEEGHYQLIGKETQTMFADNLKSAAEALVFANRNKLRLR